MCVAPSNKVKIARSMLAAPTRVKPPTTVLALLALAACYTGVITGMIQQWSNDEDMGHGFFVPFVAAWIIWRKRERWQNDQSRPSNWGFLILTAGALLQILSALGAGLFAGSVSLLVSLIGLVVAIWGFERLRSWAFPLLLLVFMLPKLAIVYNQVTLPLQLLASRLAAGMLTASGFGVIREGNILDVGGHKIAVAEACSGIRFLLPLAFMATVFGYFTDPRAWMRLVLMAAAVPIAIVANGLRVAMAGAWPYFAEGTPHEVSGLIIFVACLATLPAARLLAGAAHQRLIRHA